MNCALMLQYENTAKEKLQEGSYAEAEQFFRAALREAETSDIPNPFLVRQLKTLGVFYLALREYAESASLFERATAVERNLLDADNLGHAESLNQLGLLYQIWGESEKAERAYKQALDIEERARLLTHGQGNSALQHTSQHHLAMVQCARKKNNEQALQSCVEATTRNEQNTVSANRSMPIDLHALAANYCQKNRRTEAHKICSWVLELSIEQIQYDYLGCLVYPGVSTTHSYETHIAEVGLYDTRNVFEDEWRPSSVFRSQPVILDTALHPISSNRIDVAISDGRAADVFDECWRPTYSFVGERN